MAKLRESIISNSERTFITKSLAEHRRLDGRAFDEFRELNIEFSKDWGCCYVSLGKTRVLAQVSCEVQQPKSSRPSEGMLNINVELSPMGAPHFETGRQSELSVQLNRILEKCIKDSKAIDLESLCIKVNEKVWALRVDVNVLNHEGNIADCASVAALAALVHFRRPDVSSDGEEIIVHTYAQRDPIPTVIHHYPICLSYAIFNEGATILADPALLEEGVADAMLMIGLNAYKELCALHLGGSALMTSESILKCTAKAAARANIVVQQIKDTLKKDLQDSIISKVHLLKKKRDGRIGGKACLVHRLKAGWLKKKKNDRHHAFSGCLVNRRTFPNIEIIPDYIVSVVTEIQNKKISFEISSLFDKDTNSLFENLGVYLDKWNTKEQKKRKKFRKNAKNDMETTDEAASVQSKAGIVESLGRGSAALLPCEVDGNGKAWAMSSEEEESDAEVVMCTVNPKENDKEGYVREDGTIGEGDSEEEKVVILNAGDKSHTKKRKRMK